MGPWAGRSLTEDRGMLQVNPAPPRRPLEPSGGSSLGLPLNKRVWSRPSTPVLWVHTQQDVPKSKCLRILRFLQKGSDQPGRV